MIAQRKISLTFSLNSEADDAKNFLNENFAIEFVDLQLPD